MQDIIWNSPWLTQVIFMLSSHDLSNIVSLDFEVSSPCIHFHNHCLLPPCWVSNKTVTNAERCSQHHARLSWVLVKFICLILPRQVLWSYSCYKPRDRLRPLKSTFLIFLFKSSMALNSKIDMPIRTCPKIRREEMGGSKRWQAKGISFLLGMISKFKVWTRWFISVIPILKRLRQKDHRPRPVWVS